MSRSFPKLVTVPAAADGLQQDVQIGLLVRVDERERPWVRIGEAEPVLARCAAVPPADLTLVPNGSMPVLLFLEGGHADLPIIVGFVADTLSSSAKTAAPVESTTTTVSLDGKRLFFEASEEVVLKCGQSSITLQAGGRIVIKGVELVSRAAGSNKIRGAAVSIN